MCSLKDLDLIREHGFLLFCVFGWLMVLACVINITPNLVCRSWFLPGLGIKIS